MSNSTASVARRWVVSVALGGLACPIAANPVRSTENAGASSVAIDRLLDVSQGSPELPAEPLLHLRRQDHERLQTGRSVVGTPITIGGRAFAHGLGTHASSRIRVYCPKPIERLTAWIGVDDNERTRGGQGSVVFSLMAEGGVLYRSAVLRGGQAAERIDVDTRKARILDLCVDDAGDGATCDHADWAEAIITLEGGQTIHLDDMKQGAIPHCASPYPFSFVCDGRSSSELLGDWRRETVERSATTWTDPRSGLRVRWEVTRHDDFPSAEWMLWLENTGKTDTAVIEDIQALDISVASPLSGRGEYRLHRTKGAPSNPTDFEAACVTVKGSHNEVLSAGGGRSSNRDFPFFKIETGEGSYIFAVGWSGQWRAELSSPEAGILRVRAGIEQTRFCLHPGEKVRMPRILVLHGAGDTVESNAQFRQLIYRHYCARRDGERLLPTLYCNTCFTRGGGWLNECNAQNQISLIHAYAPLGLEALLTDAGWFEGGWPAGAGNWTPRKDAYPEGMGPVAAAAKERKMIYGLWFEPERVVAGTWLHKNHPEWLLARGEGPQQTYLLNFGLAEVREYFFGIVKGFMDLPGFRVYRQDFNMDPLEYWRHNDAPDRQGITEIRYITGLYEYWDRIARSWPDSLRIECASGGRRIDIETVRRMHIHQKSDYWFDNEVDQASIWGLSQYLPNNVFMTPLNRMDEYSFHSAMATSLCMGWIADAPDFDVELGKRLLGRYRAVRHYLIGAWYPLLPYSRDPRVWMAVQYHRPDLDEGMILAFRRPESPYRTCEVALHGLQADAAYELTSDTTGENQSVHGAELMKRHEIAIPERHRSDLIVYKRR